MKLIWSYIKKYPGQIIGAMFGSFCFVIVTLGLPTLLARIIDTALVSNNRSDLKNYIFIMLGLVLIGFIGQLISRYFVSTLSNGMVRDIRNDVYEHIQLLSHHEFQELGVSSLTTRITTDAYILMQFMIMVMGMGFTSPIMIIVSIFMTLNISTQLGLLVAPVIPFIILVILLVVRVAVPISENQQTALDSINKVQRENIIGIRVIRAFTREIYQEQRFEHVNNIYRKATTKLYEVLAMPQPTFLILIDIAFMILIIFGAQFINMGSLQVGALVAMIQYVMEALFSFTLFSQIFMMYPRAQVSADRLAEVLNTPISVKQAENPIKETNGSGELEFKHVSFAYPDSNKPVLRDISFKTKAGQTIAFIGSTGSGKSTIVKLIPRFYDVTSGQILLDGVDIRELDIDVLRSKIGFTPQRANLFTGAISDNLRYGFTDADLDDLNRSTYVAQASEFISGLDLGYLTQLAEGGTNLSGGQRQRLSIARTIIGEHEVYIFDDSFSALDFKTDAKVRQALQEETQHATTVIVGQRISSIMNADQIIVLEHGTIAAQGTHKELLKSSPLYREIAKSQLTEEELAHE